METAEKDLKVRPEAEENHRSYVSKKLEGESEKHNRKDNQNEKRTRKGRGTFLTSPHRV